MTQQEIDEMFAGRPHVHEISEEDYEKGEGICEVCGYLVHCHDR